MGKLNAVDVVAAVLQNDNGEFLLCQRPNGKVCAGFWEFPGGKIEKNESLFDALKREIAEELNLQVLSAHPWLVREFAYPHANVRLHFWKVKKFAGVLEKSKIEHADFCWQSPFESLKVAPLLPANHAIIQSLQIPEVAFITRAELEGEEKALESLKNALLQNPRALIQIRDKNLKNRAEFAENVAEMVANFPQSVLIVNDDFSLAQKNNAKGIHLSSKSLKMSTKRPDFALCGASVHSPEELEKAIVLSVDYVFLSPVFATKSHPNAAILGESGFAQIAENSPIPVFALGGVQFSHLENLQNLGAHGIALLRGY